MLKYIMDNLYNYNGKSNVETTNTKTNMIKASSFISSPSNKGGNKQPVNKNIIALNKETIRARINIEKGNHLISNHNYVLLQKKHIKTIVSALIDVFTKSNFMIKQINKLNGNIDHSNDTYIKGILNNLCELNNIFDSIYERYNR